MKPPKVNLLDGATSIDRQKRRFLPSPIAVVIIFLLSFGFGRLTMSQTATEAMETFADVPIINQMRHLIGSPDRKLKGESQDRINILLLGMGGEGHEGPQLTDTIMVASIRPTDGRVAVLSIPRDLIVPLPNVGWKKINSANAYGEMAAPGRGAEKTRDELESLLGLTISYYVRVDFNGFKALIDGVGGIDVFVEKTFTDASYPTSDKGYQTVTFRKGWRHFLGDEALVYARSRHGNNGEGGDFARAKRQQKVISALKSKMLDAKTYMSPAAIANTLAALQANITTNLQVGEILRLARMAQQVNTDKIVHKVLDNGPDSPLTDAILGGAYVLVPKHDDWTAIRKVAASVLDETPIEEPAAPPVERKTRIEIRNGTSVNGHARDMSISLSTLGFEISKIGNAADGEIATTIIYDLTDGDKSDLLNSIKSSIKGTKLTKTKSAHKGPVPADTDFVIVLGKSSL